MVVLKVESALVLGDLEGVTVCGGLRGNRLIFLILGEQRDEEKRSENALAQSKSDEPVREMHCSPMYLCTKIDYLTSEPSYMQWTFAYCRSDNDVKGLALVLFLSLLV